MTRWLALITATLLLPSVAQAGSFYDDFDDGILAPWVSNHGSNVDDGADLVGSSYPDHLVPSALISPGMPAGAGVFISANQTRIAGTEGGFVLRMNGNDFCGFYLIDLGPSTFLFWSAAFPQETFVGPIDPMQPDTAYLVEAGLDPANQFTLW
ncbi:MAG: hypothetical protein VX498_04940, partial [Myxococcota bacterium]|nr:hypothetical protein [Myxococcota bacterium]